jgi:hypothetical protein
MRPATDDVPDSGEEVAEDVGAKNRRAADEAEMFDVRELDTVGPRSSRHEGHEGFDSLSYLFVSFVSRSSWFQRTRRPRPFIRANCFDVSREPAPI